MVNPDPWSNPDGQNEATFRAMATRLEERGRHPRFAAMIKRYVETLPRQRPLTVLDLGCGTGVVARHLAEWLDDGSKIHAADVSAGFLREAAKLAPGVAIQWDHLTGGKLSYEEASFDAVAIHTLLSHVEEPGETLRGVARILKPGGRLIVFDADHAGTTYGLPDFAEMRRIDHLLTSAIACHPDICRQLPRLLKSVGLVVEDHAAEVISECGRGDFWLSSVRGFARMIPELGILPEDEAAAWVGQLLQSHEEGTFFAAGTYYTFFARKEESVAAVG